MDDCHFGYKKNFLKRHGEGGSVNEQKHLGGDAFKYKEKKPSEWFK
jgi:hypothetical protein